MRSSESRLALLSKHSPVAYPGPELGSVGIIV